MAQTQRTNNSMSAAELKANEAKPQRKARTSSVPQSEIDMETRIVAMREKRKPMAEGSAERSVLDAEIKAANATLSQAKALRILAPRASNVLQALKNIGAVAKGNYKIDMADIDELFTVLQTKLADTYKLFKAEKAPAEVAFSFTRSRNNQDQ